MTSGFARPARSACLALLASLSILTQGASRAAEPTLELQVELDPGTRRFTALASVVPELRDFRFELHESLEVISASADGKMLRVIPAGRDGAVRGWRVVMPADSGRLHLEYGGTLPALDRNLDDRGVLRGLPPMASNDGCFLPAGAAWYPKPAALFTYRVKLSVPGDQRALVPGRLQTEEVPIGGSGRYRAGFESLQPADGIDLMVGPWVVREKIMTRASGGPVRLRTYFSRELDDLAGFSNGYLDDTRRYLELYSGEIGAYPFTEFSVVEAPLPTGFGMRTLTYMGTDVLKLPFIRAVSLGHEVLHNWWGNGAYVAYAAGNWSEGLTTFMADYAYKERESAQSAREMRLGWLRDFAAVPAGAQQSLASFRSRVHGAAAAVGYGKSAMVFLMLRDAIGDEAFRRGIRGFWEKYRFKVASWADLRGAFERASDRPLGTFFDQWLNRTSGPAVKIAEARTKQANGKISLTIALEQSSPAYVLRLPLEIVYAGRSEIRWVDFERSSATVTLQLEALPSGVRLDPDLRVWRVLGREQLPSILRQWVVARAPRLMMASRSADMREAAESVAKRLCEVAPVPILPEDLGRGTEPILLAGLYADVDAALARAGLPPRPASVADRGSAQVWTIDREAGMAPVAVFSARDANALRALLRPLPHYGAQSWLVFEGGRVLERGVWSAPGPLISVHSDR